MTKQDIIRKLTSRKFWIAVVGFITPLLLAFGVAEASVTQVTAIIMARADVVALALLVLLLVVGALCWLRPIFFTAFDREYAQSQGLPTRLISYLMSAVVALAIVLSIRVMGIVLLLSLLTLPVVIANTLSRDYRRLVVVAPLVGVVGNLIGLLASYYLEVPPGAAIIFTLSIALIATKIAYLCRLKLKIAQKS